MAITWADVVDFAPELEVVPLPAQNAFLRQVNAELSASAWGTWIDMGRVYLAAHLGTMALRKGTGGPVVSESVGSVSRAYAASVAAGAAQLGSTSYGLEFERLRDSLPGVHGMVC